MITELRACTHAFRSNFCNRIQAQSTETNVCSWVAILKTSHCWFEKDRIDPWRGKGRLTASHGFNEASRMRFLSFISTFLFAGPTPPHFHVVFISRGLHIPPNHLHNRNRPTLPPRTLNPLHASPSFSGDASGTLASLAFTHLFRGGVSPNGTPGSGAREMCTPTFSVGSTNLKLKPQGPTRRGENGKHATACTIPYRRNQFLSFKWSLSLIELRQLPFVLGGYLF